MSSSTKPKVAAVTRETHGTRRWRRYTNYKFAASDAVAPLVAPEVSKAAAAFPLGFLKVGDSVRLVALLGLKTGQNLFVAPDGRWIGGYIPAVFRTYPFRLADNGKGSLIVCAVEDETLLTDGPEGEPFFEGEEGNSLSPAVHQVVEVLQHVAQAERATGAASALLDKHELLVPWQFRRHGEDKVYTLGDVLTVDEAKLNALAPEALVDVRNGGALALAYAQLLSQQHMATLVALEAAHAKAQAQLAAAAQSVVNPKGELDLEFLNQNSVLDFRGLK